MKTISADKFRENMFNLIEEVSLEDYPIKITGKKKNAILFQKITGIHFRKPCIYYLYLE